MASVSVPAPTCSPKLPMELIFMIAKYVKRPSHLRNLILTSKDWQEAASPQLYYSLRFDFGTLNDHKLKNTFNTENAALNHVREITLGIEPRSKEPDLESLLIMIVEHLPLDGLLSFRWQDWKPLPFFAIKKLWQTQTRMEAVQGFALRRPFDISPEKLIQSHHSFMSNCKHLELFISSPGPFKLAKALMAVSTELDSLTIRVIRQAKHLPFVSQLNLVYPTTAFLDELFSENGAQQACPESTDRNPGFPLCACPRVARILPLPTRSLTSLTLFNVDLGISYHDWHAHFPLEQVSTLRLRDCPNWGIFLVDFVDVIPGALRHFELQASLADANHYNDDWNFYIDDILESMSSLVTLHVSLIHVTHMYCLSTCIPKIWPDLQSFSFHVFEDEYAELTFDNEDFTHLKDHCPSLRQLSLALIDSRTIMPEVHALYTGSQSRDAESILAEADHDDETVLYAPEEDPDERARAADAIHLVNGIKDAISEMPNLRTVRISTWPISTTDSVKGYDAVLRAQAESIFHRARRHAERLHFAGKLSAAEIDSFGCRAVAFGCVDQDPCVNVDESRIYIRRDVPGIFGAITCKAEPMSKQDCRSYLPDSDILKTWVAYAPQEPGHLPDLDE